MNKKIFSIWMIVGVCIIFFAGFQTVHAEPYTLLEKVPWETTDFPTYIEGVYNFSVAFVAVAALLMISIGGFYYIVSAGNQAQAGTAKTMIKDALLGLIIVFVSWLILHTINPDLLKMEKEIDLNTQLK
ncbi:MAG: hypothetical protein ACD_48C00411G0001 [uncultured bacterium]|nr:MAG: hypothetical protein ACD_48C00411G0001 [uncultured bacterium]